ncbi:MAG: hypothetical protein M3422_20045 [Actinomycetota bacterium]|nr:hypothetical protein [Actinomycetota bacterium]
MPAFCPRTVGDDGESGPGAGHEHVAELVGGLVVALGRGLGVDGEREPRVAVAEPGLRRLQVDVLAHHCRCIGPPQIVEAEPFELCGGDGRKPDAQPPVAVVERPVVGVGSREQQPVVVRAGESSCRQVRADDVGQLRRDAQGAVARFRLRCADLRAAAAASGHLLLHGDGAPQQVDVADAQPGHLTPSQPGHDADPDHRRVVRPHGVGERDQLVRGRDAPAGAGPRRELDAAARAAADPVAVDGVVEDGAQGAVNAMDRPRLQALGPSVDQRLHLGLGDGTDATVAERRQEVLAQRRAVTVERRRPLGRVRRHPFVGRSGERHAARRGVDPGAAGLGRHLGGFVVGGVGFGAEAARDLSPVLAA